MSEPKAATFCRHGNLPYSTGARVAWRLASKVVAFSKQKRKIHDNSVGVVFRHEDGKHHPFRPSSQARERDHFLVGCFLRLRSHSQLARGLGVQRPSKNPDLTRVEVRRLSVGTFGKNRCAPDVGSAGFRAGPGGLPSIWVV